LFVFVVFCSWYSNPRCRHTHYHWAPSPAQRWGLSLHIQQLEDIPQNEQVLNTFQPVWRSGKPGGQRVCRACRCTCRRLYVWKPVHTGRLLQHSSERWIWNQSCFLKPEWCVHPPRFWLLKVHPHSLSVSPGPCTHSFSGAWAGTYGVQFRQRPVGGSRALPFLVHWQRRLWMKQWLF
jgi:hypothetical protein